MMKTMFATKVSVPRSSRTRLTVQANKGFDKGDGKKESFQQIYIEEMKKEKERQAAAASAEAPAQPASSDEVSFEATMKKGRSKRKPTTQVRVESAVRDVALGKGPQPVQGQAETAYVQALGILFFIILVQGIIVAGSGFMSEEMDQLVQNTVYKWFSPTVGLFLAGSTGYGLWKTREDKKNEQQ